MNTYQILIPFIGATPHWPEPADMARALNECFGQYPGLTPVFEVPQDGDYVYCTLVDDGELVEELCYTLNKTGFKHVLRQL